MLPPETMQTTRPRRRDRRARRRAPARLRPPRRRAPGRRADGRPRRCPERTATAPASSGRARSHIAGRSAFEPAPSTNEARYSTVLGSPAASDAARGAPVSGSHAITRVAGETAASALAIPVRAHPRPRARAPCRSPSRRSASSSPITPLPAITARRAPGDEEAVEPGVGARLHRLPPAVEGDELDAAAEPLDRVELRARRVVGRDDGRGHPELARPSRRPAPCSPRSSSRPRRATRTHRAWRIALDAPRSLKQPIGWRHSSFSQISQGASTSSRTSGVSTTTSAVSARARSIASSGIRTAPRRRAPLAGASDAQAAAARSSTARPSDLNTVSSSSSRRPGWAPTRSSPSSARMCSGPMPASSTARAGSRRTR